MPKYVDGYAYIGSEAFRQMEASAFTIASTLTSSYITTAALRRSGCHPEPGAYADLPDVDQSEWNRQNTPKMADLHEWLIGQEDPHSDVCAGKLITIDEVKVMHVYKPTVTVTNSMWIVIPSNYMRVVIGARLTNNINNALENDESPLQQKSAEQCSEEIQQALRHILHTLRINAELQHAAEHHRSGQRNDMLNIHGSMES